MSHKQRVDMRHRSEGILCGECIRRASVHDNVNSTITASYQRPAFYPWNEKQQKYDFLNYYGESLPCASYTCIHYRYKVCRHSPLPRLVNIVVR